MGSALQPAQHHEAMRNGRVLFRTWCKQGANQEKMSATRFLPKLPCPLPIPTAAYPMCQLQSPTSAAPPASYSCVQKCSTGADPLLWSAIMS